MKGTLIPTSLDSAEIISSAGKCRIIKQMLADVLYHLMLLEAVALII